MSNIDRIVISNFFIIVLLSVLFACSTPLPEWPVPAGVIKVTVVGPVFRPEYDKNYRFPGMLNQAISDIIVNQSKLSLQQTNGRAIEIKRKNRLFKYKKTNKIWNQIQAKSEIGKGFYDNRVITKIFKAANRQIAGYELGIHMVPPKLENPEVLMIDGYRLLSISEDEIEANMFKVPVLIKGKDPVNELKKTVLRLLTSSDFSSPDFGYMGFVKIGGGCFTTGKHNQQTKCVDDFYLGKFIITQSQWESVMGENPSFNKKGGDYPVENISWKEVQIFIEKLSELTGLDFRLPTEYEWEFACAGRESDQKFGTETGEIHPDLANYIETMEAGRFTGSSPVGQYPPNQFGLFDMSGNVWEWTSDMYSVDGSTGGIFGSFFLSLTEKTDIRTKRGGSFDSTPAELKCAKRGYAVSSIRSADIGFRLILDY